jgi:hypothetical protein
LSKLLGDFGENKTAYSDGEGGLIIETKLNLSDFAEATKQVYKENSGSKGWGDTPYDPKNHIACIPPEIIGDLNKKNIMKGYQVIDMPALKRWLNDPDNRIFRTRGGQI